MKVTLIVVMALYQQFSNSTSVTIPTSSGNLSMSSVGPNIKIVRIPMPDLKSCLEARHQFDDYQFIQVASCSAE